MTSTKFTSGQWYIEHVPYDHVRAIQDDLSTICVWADDYKPQANANLIAAAPDLYVELEKIHKLISQFSESGFNGNTQPDLAEEIFASQATRFDALLKARSGL